MKVRVWLLIVFAFIGSYNPFVWALDLDQSTQAFSERARTRSYPGGLDEEDLKVQEALPSPVLKVNEKSIHEQVYERLFEEDKKSNSKKEG